MTDKTIPQLTQGNAISDTDMFVVFQVGTTEASFVTGAMLKTYNPGGGGGGLTPPVDATNIANGAVTNTEFQYLDGVTSAIQTQLNAMLQKAGGTVTGNVTLDTGAQLLLDDSVTTAQIGLPLSFDGDSDTGLYRFGANQMSVSCGAVEICRFFTGTQSGLRMLKLLSLVFSGNLASATSLDIGTGNGNTMHITGTTTITSLGTQAIQGAEITTIFDGILQLTNSTNMNCIGNANITTAAGDEAKWRYHGTSVWKMISYLRQATAIV